jgi:energy-coupling factor transport system substrate-specific component
VSWQIASFALLGLVIVAGFAWYERTHPGSKVLALVATLAALAALGRVAFAPLPNVKPTTDIVLLSGYVLGGAPGFAVGAVGAFASNLVFGQGPWTPWQMAGWGMVGVFGAALGSMTGRRLGRRRLALACAVAGLFYGLLMNLSTLLPYAGSPTFAQWAAVQGAAIPFDAAHAIGNLLFCLACGPAFVRVLQRYRARLEVRWVSRPPLAVEPLESS